VQLIIGFGVRVLHLVCAFDQGDGVIMCAYPEITKPQHAASDHAAVYIDVDL
jgi:hypothetical protein